jgi:hypothetical protein
MRLLKRETEAQPDGAAPEAQVSVTEAPEGVRACPTCHAPLEADQDWCLQCGSAQSRLGGRMPGMRAASTVVALTTVLVGGAVAASYAALQDEPGPAAGTTPAQVAQAPSPAPSAPSTPTPSPLDPPPTTPATTADPIPGDRPAPPKSSDTPKTPSAADRSGDASTGGASAGGGSSGSSGASGSTNGTGTTTTQDDAAKDATPQPIELDAGAGALYDPYTRDTAAGDAGKAFDDNITTSFPITVADGSEQVGAGLAVDLGKQRSIREIDLTLKTPGAGLEVYATDEADLPPDVLDSRWAHLRSLASAGSAVDGHQTIKLGKGTTKYRHVLLWFTTPPESGTTVRVSELQLLA